jgi:acyl dehydratase
MTAPLAPPLPPMNAALLIKALLKRRRPAPEDGRVATAYRIEGIDLAQVERYRHALGFSRDAIPVTFYYLLTQRAHLATMLDRPFPFPIAGIIHAENELAEHVAPDPAQPLTLHTTVTIAPPSSSGAVYCVFDTRATQGGHDVFTCVSKYLAVRGQRKQKTSRPQEEKPSLPEIATWHLAPSSGRQYAAVSSDWNPIHLWPWTARLMGLSTPIIHGMHTVGKACAALEAYAGQHVGFISARFKAPVPLPNQIHLCADLAAGTYTASCQGRVAVEGEFLLAQAGATEKRKRDSVS